MDVYEIYPSVCETKTGLSNARFTQIISETTGRACEHLCTNLEPDRCSGYYYDMTSRECTLTSYTAEGYNGNQTRKCGGSRVHYYRRIRHIGEL